MCPAARLRRSPRGPVVGVVEETTYFWVSLKNGAPGSSSTVRVDQAGANISNVVRPSRMPEADPVSSPIEDERSSGNP